MKFNKSLKFGKKVFIINFSLWDVQNLDFNLKLVDLFHFNIIYADYCEKGEKE